MNNKAQGLSLNTIVIAIIVLIVLVTLIAVFVGALGLFTKDITKDCTNKAGMCQAKQLTGPACGTNDFGSEISQVVGVVCTDADGVDTGEVCCRKL